MQMASVEVHEECRCVCRVQAEDCSDQQEYHPDECRCVCQNSEAELACRNAKDKVRFRVWLKLNTSDY